jgi:hypothetical protein
MAAVTQNLMKDSNFYKTLYLECSTFNPLNIKIDVKIIQILVGTSWTLS